MTRFSRRDVLKTLAPLAAAVSGVSAQTPAVASAGDWPQFLGPMRNGVAPGPPVAEAWGRTGPKVVWRRTVGAGLAGPVVSGARLVLFHRVGGEEVVEALDRGTGMPVWRYAYPTRYRDDFGFDEGPRAVPVVAAGVVYTFGAEGQLHAIDLTRGSRLWSVDTASRFRVPKAFFGAGGSPVVDDGRVIANIGGEQAGVVAFEARSGTVLWSATDDDASYSSGIVATVDGARTAVFVTRDNLLGLDPASGRVRFARRWRARQAASVNAATPLAVGNRLFVSSEYGPGAALLQVNGGTVSEIWASDDVLSTHYATAVYHAGHLYGFHGRQEFGPSFRAVAADTGRVAWSEERFRAGSVILVGDRLLILRESGELLLAPASPQGGLRPLARATVLAPVARPYMALAGGFLFARDERSLVCLDLRA